MNEPEVLAQLTAANITLFFSLLDVVLEKPEKRTPAKIAEYVRQNYAALGDHRSETGDAMIGFIVSRLEGAGEGAANAL